MENIGIDIVSNIAVKKFKYFKKSPSGYFIYSMLAGFFCAIGMAFAYSASGTLYASENLQSTYKIVLGIAFALSFTLIVFAGAELFTGNVFVMSVGALTKKIRMKNYAALLIFCLAANFLGACLMAWIYSSTGLMNGETGDLIVYTSSIKMNLPFKEAFFRGVMCNIMVCMATWSTAKMKSEGAKLVVLLWCVVGFVTPGYEHSIANIALFTMAMLAPQTTPAINLSGFWRNLVPVTLGNFVGGAIFVAFVYWFVASKSWNKASDESIKKSNTLEIV